MCVLHDLLQSHGRLRHQCVAGIRCCSNLKDQDGLPSKWRPNLRRSRRCSAFVQRDISQILPSPCGLAREIDARTTQDRKNVVIVRESCAPPARGHVSLAPDVHAAFGDFKNPSDFKIRPTCRTSRLDLNKPRTQYNDYAQGCRCPWTVFSESQSMAITNLVLGFAMTGASRVSLRVDEQRPVGSANCIPV